MDVVIDCVGGNTIGTIGGTIFDAVAKEAISSRPHGPALEYVYTSGTWVRCTGRSRSDQYEMLTDLKQVHGDHPLELYNATSDRAPLHDSMSITKWRLPHERHVLATAAANATSLSANVIRPSLLYGYSGSLVGELFASARAGVVKFAAAEKDAALIQLATIHADDLAELFVLVAEQVRSLTQSKRMPRYYADRR